MLRFLTLLFTALFATAALAGNSFSIAPTHVSVDLSRPQTLVYLVKNTGDAPIHIRLGTEFLALGSPQYQRGKTLLTPAEEAATDLSPYILISPRVLSLLPTETREVRVSVRLTKPLPPGTYRSHIFATMLEFAQQNTTQKEVDGKQLGVNLNLLLKIATAIYGNVGEAHATPVFACSRNKDGKLHIDATNHSPWHISNTIKGYSDNSVTPAFTVHAEIYRDSISDVDPNWTPPASLTALHLTWQNDDEKQIYTTDCQLKK